MAGLFLLFAAASVCTRLPFLRAGLLNMDEASHLLGAWEWLRGGRLYVDFADNKPPLVYLYYAAAQVLFGNGIESVRLLTAIALVPLTALGAAAFFGGGRRGVAAGVAYVVLSSAMLASDSQATHCEHVMLLPIAWSLVVLRTPEALRSARRLFAAGALVGIATLAKQPAAACLAAPGALVLAAALRGRGPPSRSWAPGTGLVAGVVTLETALLAGFAAPLLAAAALFAQAGSLRSAVFWTWQFNLGHIDNPMPLGDKAERLVAMGSLVVPAIAPLVVAASLARAHTSCGLRRRLPLALAAAALGPAFLGWRLFGHYFLPFVFAMSLAAGPFLAARGRVAWRTAVLAMGAIALAGFTIANRIVYDPARELAEVTRPAYERIGEALRADHCDKGKEDTLFVWGYAPNVYVYAEERPASRFVVPIDTLTGYLAGNDAAERGLVDTRGRIRASHWAALMADLTARMPAHLVDTAPADLNRWGRFSMVRFPLLDAFVRRNYHVLAVVDGAVVYARNGCDAPAVSASR